jgi:subtilisin family serine protease
MLATTRMRIVVVTLLCCLFAAAAQPGSMAGSGWKQVIVKCDSADLDQVKQVLGATVAEASHGYYLLNVRSDASLAPVSAMVGRTPIVSDDNQPVRINRGNARGNGPSGTTSVSLGGWVNYYGALAPRIYTEQSAVSQIELKNALVGATGKGVRVAVIDTGIDFKHPFFPPGSLLPGRNYVGRTPIPSEYDDPVLSQSTLDLTTLEQSSQDLITLEQSTVDVVTLEQSSVDLITLEKANIDWQQVSSIAPMFGHGTTTAGLVHLVAPRAQIIPLKAFDSSGAGSEWMIVQAILDAVDMGADVINMSFASPHRSQVVEDAIKFAASRGVALAAAAGNGNEETLTYPAALADVMGVAAVTEKDVKASFSNYGTYVDISSPGVDLITAYPGGLARVSGTSDSTPLVAGVLALAKDNGTTSSQLRDRVLKAVDPIKDPLYSKGKLGSGRVNAAKAVNGGSNPN